MKLSEVDSSANVKLLLYGDSGSGKTCFAASFPTPILYLDFDGKVSSAARFHKADQERLNNIEVFDLRPTISGNPTQEFLGLIPKINANKEAKTLVLDSITTFSAATLQHIVKSNPAIKRVQTAQGVQPGMQDYGILKREFARLIPSILSLNMNVVMLAHIKTDKDELSGEIVRQTQMDGSFAQELPIYFEEVWHSFVNSDGDYVAQTKSDYRFKCRSQIPGLPQTIPLSYSALAKYL